MTIRLTSRLGKTLDGNPQFQVSLTWQERQRSRLAVMLSNGMPAAIVLPRGDPLEDGDVLGSEEGYQVLIRGADEEVLEIKAESPEALTRVVYHLANRHAAAMLTPEAVFIEPDPILADLARHLGASVRPVRRPFEPERGAYHGHSHGQDHHHHGHHRDEFDDEDRAFGNVGEALSRAAHAR